MKKTIMINARFSLLDYDNLDRLSKSTGRTHSQTIRDAIQFLTDLSNISTPIDLSSQDQIKKEINSKSE